MKVLLLNGGPHKEGCTYTALSEVAATLQAAGVDGNRVVGCEARGRMYRLRQLCGEESLFPR